jgi:magnesium transporter
LIVTILPEKIDILKNNSTSSRLSEYFSDLRYFILYKLISDVLTVTISNVALVRKRLHATEKELIINPHNLTAEEVMDMRNDIAQFADIVEDQDVSFNLLQNLFINKQDIADIERVKQVISGYERLNRTITRLEEKAESLRLHFMLVQQEQSTRKINVLTIIQAIFVPLTFLAGVYGMNFVNMPELQWPWAYFAVWGIFIALAAALLIYFKKHGWFD